MAPVINSPLHLKEGEQAITIWAKSAVVVATQISSESSLPASGFSDERATLFFVALYEVDEYTCVVDSKVFAQIPSQCSTNTQI